MLYLLDTSVCVSILRDKAQITDLPLTEQCALSVITLAELEIGIVRSTRQMDQRARVFGLRSAFRVLPWDESIVPTYGLIRLDLEKRGLPIGPLDLLIAAHALHLKATLVTGNVSEFKRVKGLKVLAWK